MMRWLVRLPIVGEFIEIIYCMLLVGGMIWTASIWAGPIWLLVGIEIMFVIVMLAGYFWIANTAPK